MPGTARLSGFFGLLLLTWLAVALQLVPLYWPETGTTLADTDNAMRLVEMRTFVAGQGWFDLHEARIDPPHGWDSHWSRLIDAGLAGLLAGFRLVAAEPLAERLMRVSWPLLCLLPALAGVLSIALRLGGHPALRAAALVAVLGLPAYQQFIPGRIDHHNVQITLAVLVLAATAWSDRRPWAAAAAGVLTALALAIGFESLPFVILCGAAFAVRFVLSPSRTPLIPAQAGIQSRTPGLLGPRFRRDERETAAARSLSAYGLALGLGTLAAFLVSVGPDRWGVTACDTLAINIAGPLVVTSLAFAVLGRLPVGTIGARLIAVAMIGGAAVAAVVWLDPRCLGGPFALMDPAARHLWLDQVRESQPLWVLVRTVPAVAAITAAFPVVALVAAVVLGRDPARRRDAGFLAVAATLAGAVMLTVATAKVFAYAMWFGMPVAAALAAQAWTLPLLSRLSARVAVTMLLTPAVVGTAAGALATALSPPPAAAANETSAGCFADADYRVLATLPPGLVVTPIDYGPFVLALTGHSVLGAPYHRLSDAILSTYHIFAGPPEVARDELVRRGAAYVVVCRADRAAGAGLAARLRAGDPPDWLRRVGADRPDGLAAYRVLPPVPAADPTRP